MLDLRELIRLARASESNRDIARLLHSGRNTFAAYRVWAGQHHPLEGDFPPTP